MFRGAKPLKSPPWRRDCSSHPAFLLSTMMGKTSEFQTHFVTWVSSLTDSSTSLSMSTLVLHRGIKTANILKVAAGRKAEERHLVMLYKSLVLSVVDYALPMINISQNLMGKLERLQNECLHIITGCPSSAPVHVLQYWSWTFLNHDRNLHGSPREQTRPSWGHLQRAYCSTGCSAKYTSSASPLTEE